MNFNFNFILQVVLLTVMTVQTSATVFSSCIETGTSSLNILCTVQGQLTSSSRTVALSVVSTPITLLVISNQAFTSIPDNLLSGLSVTNAIISGNGLTSLTAGTFAGATTIGTVAFAETLLSTIAATAFTPIASSLTALSFASSSITNTRFLTLSSGIQSLRTLSMLTLDTNSLISLEPGWFNGLTGLKTFSAKTNQIASINANAFQFNTALTSIDLTSNLLTDMTGLNTALTPLLSTLQTLTLTSNRFTSIVDFPAMPALKILNLNLNLITSIVSSNSFDNKPVMTTINLANNQLASIPAIVNQLRILNYDLSSNSILAIPNNAFSRSTVPTVGITAKLNGNAISTFPVSAFCSASTNFYTDIDIGSASMANFNKCLFKQLKPANAANTVTLNVVAAAGVTDFTSICNCANAVFATNNQVTLTGACATFNDPCTTTPYVDDCPTTYTCASASTSGSDKIRFEYIGFIFMNAVFLVISRQF